MHLLFDCGKIFFGDCSRQDEIIVASVFDLRTDRVLHLFTEDLDHGLCHDVSQRVTVHLQYFFFFHCKNLLQSFMHRTAVQSIRAF